MPRPKKHRRVCCLPEINRFGPLDRPDSHSHIVMTVDEYETIRLIDLERMKQEECAENMGVARTTVQAIYDAARRKIAQSLVEGRTLVIEGGEYKLCRDLGVHCGRPGCGRGRMRNNG